MATTKSFAICPECGSRFERKHHRAQFCTPAHSRTYNNRQLAEGQRIVALAKAWRAGRSVKDPGLKQAAKDAFGQLCRELDILNRQDAEAGRVAALRVYRRRQAAGLLEFQGPMAARMHRPKPSTEG